MAATFEAGVAAVECPICGIGEKLHDPRYAEGRRRLRPERQRLFPPGPRVSRPAFVPVKPIDPGLPKAAVRRLFDQAGGIKRAAVRLTLKQSQTYAYADPGESDEISFARVAALTGPETTAGAEYLAQLAGGVFLPIAMADASVGDLTAQSIREHGEACAELVRALTDQTITGRERVAALAELDQAIRVLVQLRCAVAGKGEGCLTTTG